MDPKYDKILLEKAKIERIWNTKNKWQCLMPDSKTKNFNWKSFKL